MRQIRWISFLLVLGALGAARLSAQAEGADQVGCLLCHGEPELWEGEDIRYLVPEKKLHDDIHWEKGLRCHDCHGGDPKSDDYGEAHDVEKGFRKVESPKDEPAFCGRCHSDISYMKRFTPSPRTDQVEEFWTSGHGRRLKETGDPNVATCTSCHSFHGIRGVKALDSPVYPTKVADTCATCHSDAERMKGYEYHGRPLGHGQRAKWLGSVHGEAMMEKGDLSAPTCNDCHGNHGALPPEIGSIANTCGTCHGKIADLFRDTRMKHSFEAVGLPGCAACHGAHDIHHPDDAMLGMGDGSVCAQCHKDGKHGATTVGAEYALHVRAGIEKLKSGIATAEAGLKKAERLGMEVRPAWFELTKARNALTEARSQIHAFGGPAAEEALDKGMEVVAEAKKAGDEAMEEHGARRTWLVGSLVAILIMIGLLLVFIRSYPVPRNAEENPG